MDFMFRLRSPPDPSVDVPSGLFRCALITYILPLSLSWPLIILPAAPEQKYLSHWAMLITAQPLCRAANKP